MNKKKPTQKRVGEAETQSYHKPHPNMATCSQEGTHNPGLLPEEQRVWTTHKDPNF